MSDTFFMRWMGPSFATGIDLGLWWKLLAENRYRIGLPYIGRAATISLAALLNSVAGVAEQLIFGRAIRQAAVRPPLFVLGAWRSGTSHLHAVLSQDARFAFPNTFQALNPRIFLSTESWLAPFQQLFFKPTRPMDDMRWSVASPQEDEMAIMGLCGLSPFGSWLFPQHSARYDRYFDFSQATPEERERWQETLLYFVKKMHCKYDKPLVLKSPSHTPRVGMLLQLFPGAKFVLIHRHPYQVYSSSIQLLSRVLAVSALQRWDDEMLKRRALAVYSLYVDPYLNQKQLIPKGSLVEVGFQDLEQSPIPTLRYIYDQLHLPPFDVAEPSFLAYLETVRGYRKNTYAEMDPRVKSLLASEWSRSFAEWGYEP